MSAMDVRSANTPMDKENPWGKDGTGKDVDLHLYRSMIGSLMYLTASRPDIMFAIIVATSTTEAEYIAAASGSGQVLWIQNQLLDYRHHFIKDCYEKKIISVDHIHKDDNVTDLLTKPFDAESLLDFKIKSFQFEFTRWKKQCMDFIRLLEPDVRSANTPMDKKNPWGKDGTCKDVDLHLYRSNIGSLMYLTASRPDIMFAVYDNVADLLTKPVDAGRFQISLSREAMSKGITSFILLLFHWDSVVNMCINYLRGSDSEQRTYEFIHVYLVFASVYVWIGIETTDEGTKILSTDGKPITISESLIRRNLKLNDEAEISPLPDAELFEHLALMGYNILPNQKFSFQKGQFSHQWKYLIHTIMQCLSPKSTGFNEFSSNIATAMGEGSRTPTEPHYTPSPEAQQSSPTASSSPTLPPATTATISTVIPTDFPTLRQYSRRARIAQSLVLSTVVDKPASPLGDDSQGEACPTVSGLETEQDRANIIKTSTLPHESTPRVTSFTADEGSMQHQLTKLTDLYTHLQRQQTKMATKIASQDLEMASLKARIKMLEDKDPQGAAPSGEDATIKGRSLETGEEAVVEKSTERCSNDTEELVNVLTSLDAVSILTSRVQMISVPPAAEVATGRIVRNKILKAFPLPVMSSHCQKTFPLLVKKGSPAEILLSGTTGFIDFEKPDNVYKLKKALYGLKQAPKARKFGLEESKPTKTSMSSDTKLTKEEECESIDSTKFRCMIDFAQILDIPYEGVCAFTDQWSLDELTYGVPSDGPYQTNPPSPDDIISSIRIDRE
nr:hypothetical protein [Tanacetum cinerariifolium]